MKWIIADWICGGFKAERPDGEKVFAYRGLNWYANSKGTKCQDFELRWHGVKAGQFTIGGSQAPYLNRSLHLHGRLGPSKGDLLEICRAITTKSKED